MNYVFQKTALNAVTALTLAVCTATPVIATGAAPQAIGSPIQERETVLTYWTNDLLREAEISPGNEQSPEEVITENGDFLGYAPMQTPYANHDLSRVNGILFYREPNGAHAHCSASVITSSSKSLIVTAAHCVMGTDDIWKELMMFVPAYNGTDINNPAPFDKWPIKQAFVHSSVPDGQTIDNDVAVARLHLLPPPLPIGPGESVEQKIGGALKPRITENGLFEKVKVTGYPGADRYAGRQQQCDSYTSVIAGNTGLGTQNCGLYSGHSGGPMILHPSEEPEVVAVVYNTVSGARLRESTFGVISRAADDADKAR